MPDAELTAALQVIRAAARRSHVARRLQGDVEHELLQSIVDAAVTLFEAEASSIALFETGPDRLEFRVAAGPHGAGAIGLSVAPTQGIAGYVFSSGQALALSDVASDPRFDRTTAEKTGYIPRSIAAVPLVDREATVGVLQVLDKRSSPTFSLRDMELLGVFARQAATAINATRVQRDTGRLLRAVLQGLGGDELSEAQLEVLVAEATSGLDAEEGGPFWALVEALARVRRLSDRELDLVLEILEVVARRAAAPAGWLRTSSEE